MRRWLLIALFAAACSKSGNDKPKDKPAPPSDKPAPSAPTDDGELEPTPVEPETKPAPDRGPRPQPNADACIKACVQRNQMKATSPENIEADCKSECSQK